MKIFKVDKNEIILKNGLICLLLFFPSYFVLISNIEIVYKSAFLIGFIFILGFNIYSSLRRRVIIEEDRIILITAFSKQTLGFRDIRGFRISNEQILVEPSKDTISGILFGNDIENKQEFINWLYSKYPNLDKIDAKENSIAEKIEFTEFNNNPLFGNTIEDRKNNLKLAKRDIRFLNAFSILCFVWTLFWGEPIRVCSIFSISIIFISLFLLIRFKGIIRLIPDTKIKFPSILFALIVSILGLVLRYFLNYSIYNFMLIWLPLITGTAIIAYFIITWNKNRYFNKNGVYILIAIVSFFVYNLIITINCVFDNSNSHTYKYLIQEKRTKAGRRRTAYFLKLKSIGVNPSFDELQVNVKYYNNVSEGDTININFRDGLLKIGWFDNI